jgi:TRAP transporter TAXI family solute receptor
MTRWKKILGLCLAGFVIAGTAAQASEPTLYKMSTLKSDTPSYLVMSTFAKLANKHVPGIKVEINAAGVATRHALDAGRGETDFFLLSPTALSFMKSGTAMYKTVPEAPELSKNLRAIFNFPAGVYQVLALADSGISSMEDIKGKKVFVGPASGAAKIIATTIVEGMSGLKAGEDFETVSMEWSAGAQALLKREVALYVNPTTNPSPIIREITLSERIRFFGLVDEDFKAPEIVKQLKMPGRTLQSIDPAVYGKGTVNTEPVQAIGSWIGLGTHKDVPEQVVYNMTRAFFEHLDELHPFAPWLNTIELDTALTEMSTPLHPGAQRYFEEMGLVIPGDIIAKN